MVRYINFGLFCSLLFVCGAFGASAAQIGTAQGIKNKVTGLADKTERRIHRGNGVFMNELISTGVLSRAELKFLDKTSLTIGARSTVRLDNFVYNPDDRSGKIVINTLKGAFRFVSGAAVKSAYRIKTPLATIGIRGTIIDGYMDFARQFSVFILQKGAMEVCSSVMCKLVTKAGSYVVVWANGQITEPKAWRGRGRTRNLTFRTTFPIGSGEFYINPEHFNTNDGGPLGGNRDGSGGSPASGQTGPTKY